MGPWYPDYPIRSINKTQCKKYNPETVFVLILKRLLKKMILPKYFKAVLPFRVHSFRFQWPSDLLASWGFEMEALILGWYIFTTTESVLLLTLFGSLRFIGSLLSPWFGVAGDRWGSRRMMCVMRGLVLFFALVITLLENLYILSPHWVFGIAALSG